MAAISSMIQSKEMRLQIPGANGISDSQRFSGVAENSTPRDLVKPNLPDRKAGSK